MVPEPEHHVTTSDPSGPGSHRAGLWVLAVLGLVSVVGVAAALATRQDSGELTAEVRAVIATWSDAVDERDCDAYESVTTGDFREQAEDGRDYECSVWREAESGAATWTDIVLEDVAQVGGGRATVVVDATYVAEYAEDDFIDRRDIRAQIELQEQDGAWKLAEVELDER